MRTGEVGRETPPLLTTASLTRTKTRKGNTMKTILIAMFAACAALTAQASHKAAAFIKGMEGFKSTAYSDAAGKRTIGYGFTSKAMLCKRRLTEAEASVELARICGEISKKLRTEIKGKPLTASEEAAVVSFIYNVGWATFKRSTMCRLLKEGKRGAVVAAEFSKWVYVTKGGRKVVCKGLKRRRAKERRKFMA